MDRIRFTIKTGSTGTAILAGVGVGSAVVVEFIVSVTGMAAEYAYDTLSESLNRMWSNFVIDFSNGGLPLPM